MDTFNNMDESQKKKMLSDKRQTQRGLLDDFTYMKF